jgi:hypothetical protein
MTRAPTSLPAVLFALAMTLTVQAAEPSHPHDASSTSAHELFAKTSLTFAKDLNRAHARAGYRKVLLLDANFAPAWFNLGVLAEADYLWPDAKADFEHYLAVAPDAAYASRARRELDAIKERSKQTTPTSAQLYDASIHQALALLSTKFYKESVQEAATAQSVDASRWEAYAIVSICLARQHKTESAAKFQAMALSHAPLKDRDQIERALAKAQAGGAT